MSRPKTLLPLSIFNPPLCGRRCVWEKWFFSSTPDMNWKGWRVIGPRTSLSGRAHRGCCMGKAPAVTLCQRKIATFQYQVRNNFGRAADGHIWHQSALILARSRETCLCAGCCMATPGAKLTQTVKNGLWKQTVDGVFGQMLTALNM